jgi:hypothetical protein
MWHSSYLGQFVIYWENKVLWIRSLGITGVPTFCQCFKIYQDDCKIVENIHRYQKSLDRLLKVCYVPAASTVLIAFFSSFLQRPLTVLMKQTRQPVRPVKQSIYLDVYENITKRVKPCLLLRRKWKKENISLLQNIWHKHRCCHCSLQWFRSQTLFCISGHFDMKTFHFTEWLG